MVDPFLVSVGMFCYLVTLVVNLAVLLFMVRSASLPCYGNCVLGSTDLRSRDHDRDRGTRPVRESPDAACDGARPATTALTRRSRDDGHPSRQGIDYTHPRSYHRPVVGPNHSVGYVLPDPYGGWTRLGHG